MKVLTFVVILALYHVWVGTRDIWMDYVKPVGLRLTLRLFTLVAARGVPQIWSIQALWRLIMTVTSSLPKRRFDVIIVGAGGSGMRASCNWHVQA